MKESNTKREKSLKMNFFKKVWYSISKFEKYPEMAAHGVKRTILYYTELMLIFSIIFTGAYVYYISNIVQFNEQDMNFSEKVIKVLTKEDEKYQNEMLETIQLIEAEPKEAIIFAIFISIFIAFYLATFVDIFTLSIFGMLTCMITKIKINYKAVFNMSIFALTLSIILRIIYSVITLLTGFEVKYFDIMYISIAYISLAAAIFLIKSDVIKQHLELMKIIEENKTKIEETVVIPKRKKEEDKDEKDVDKENKQEDGGEEAEGSKA